jgi:hypothetical protein
MNRYVKLVHYEFNRFRKIYGSLLLLTLLVQFGGIYYFTHSYMNKAEAGMVRESLSIAEYVEKYRKADLADYLTGSLSFNGPIVLCAAALLLYVFLIWYRDWVGKNMFIYRLLMLPGSRTNVLMAKASVILLSALGLVAFQMLLLPLQKAMFNARIPTVFRDSVPISDMIGNQAVLSIFIPSTIADFVLYYGAGLIGVLIIFTAILLERSYRLKGLVLGIGYCAAALAVLFLPLLAVETWFPNYLYPHELFILAAAIAIFIGCVSFCFSSYLISKKVTV